MGRFFWIRLVIGLLFAVVLALFAAAFFFRDRDLYSRQVGVLFAQALRESLQAELTYRSFTGNPLMGYRGGELALATASGDVVLRAQEIRAFLSLSSLLQGSPRLSRVDLIGTSADLEGLRSLAPERAPSAPPEELPVDRFVLRDLSLSTPWGPLHVEKGALRAEGLEYRFRLQGDWEGRKAEAHGRFLDGRVPELDLRGTLEDQELDVEGTLGDRYDLTGELSRFKLGELERFLPEVRKASLGGVVSTRFEVHGPPRALAAEGEGSWTGTVTGLSVKDLKGSWSYGDGKLALRVTSGGVMETPVEGSVDLDFRKETRLGLRLRGKELDPKKWKGYFTWLEGVEGVLSVVSLDLRGPVEELTGPVSVRAPEVRLWGETLQDLAAEAILRGSRPLTLRCSGQWTGASFEGKGEVNPRGDVGVRLAGTFRKLELPRLGERFPDLKGLAPQGTAQGTLLVEGPAKALRFTVRASLAALSVARGKGREPLPETEVHFAFSPKELHLLSFASRIRGARVTGSGRVALGGKDLSLAVTGRVQGADLTRWRDLIPTEKWRVKGLAGGSFRVEGTTKKPLVRVDATMPALALRDLAPVRDVRLLGAWAPDSWRVDRLSLRPPGGTLSLSGKGTLKEGVPGPFSLSGPFTGFTSRWMARKEALPFQGTLAGTLTLRGDGDRVTGEADLRTPRVVWQSLEVEGLSGKAAYDGGKVTLTRLGGRTLEGTAFLDGSLVLPSRQADPVRLDLKGTVEDILIGGWAKQHLGDLRIKGLLGGTFRLKGTEADLQVAAEGSVTQPVVQGLAFSSLLFRVQGKEDRLEFQEVKALLGDGSARAQGVLARREKGWALDFSASGENLDLALLGQAFPASLRKNLAGRVGFHFAGKGNGQGLTGKGEVAFPELKFLGFRGTDLKAPLFVGEGFVTVEEATGKAYGGTLKGQLARDLNSSRYGGRLEIRGADLAKALKDGFPQSKGTVSGKADFILRLQGDVSRTSLQDGEGRFSVVDGEISGFDGAKAVSSVTGGKPVRFRSLAGSFNVDGKSLFLLPGSRISAPPGDGAYRYLMADGSLDDKGRLDVSCLGNVNIRALNVAVGVLQGLVQSGIDGTGLLGNFLGGAVGGFTRKDFRDVSFRIRGTLDDPKLSELKIARPQKTSPIPESPGQKNKPKQEDGIRIRIEIPLGEGLVSDDSLGSQIQDQILQNAVRMILRPGDQE
ncbi:hypothetical protein [Aminomonas paucivorans]|uniref:hypothetical protein n=1 Tax=Aminomonas paucivorans TaxID=81412 RepID=UPI003333878F